MGDILPDGTIQGYFTTCRVCGMDVKCNYQGNIYDHDCTLCGSKAPRFETSLDVCCTREKGHPGECCRQKHGPHGYDNIWWTKTIA